MSWASEFDIPAGVVYLNTAGRSAQPLSVTEAGLRLVADKQSPWLGLRGSGEDASQLRGLFAELVEADPEDVSVAPSTGFAMTLVARNAQREGLLRADELVLVLERDMASAVYAWQTVCAEVHARLEVVPFASSYAEHSWTAQVLATIDDCERAGRDVAVLALPHVHWCDGSYIDLEAIARRIDQYAAEHRWAGEAAPSGRRPLLVVDATQSLGALPFSVKTVRPDFLACSVHKWLLAPYGTSLAFTNRSLRARWLPLDLHERGRKDSDLPSWDENIPFADATGYPEEFFADGRRLDAGGRPNNVLLPMTLRALQVVLSITPQVVQQHTRRLAEVVVRDLQSVADLFQILPAEQRAGHILGLRVSQRGTALGLSAAMIAQRLQEQNVFVAVRGQCVRIALYVYNTVADMNTLTALLLQLAIAARERERTGGAAKTVLVTGAHGWLAQFVVHQLLRVYSGKESPLLRVCGTYSQATDPPNWLLSENRVHMDLTQEDSVNSAIASCRPDAVVHLAAMSSPVQCHAKPDLAHKINCPQHLVNAVREFAPQSLFVFSSTDMVYDGEHAPYDAPKEEELQHAPVNVYGSTKRAFENIVLGELSRSFVLRLSNMIGKPFVFKHTGDKFLQFLMSCYAQRKYIGLKDDEIRSFVHVGDVLYIIERLIAADFDENDPASIVSIPRVLNVGGPIGLSRLQIAQKLASALKSTLTIHERAEVGFASTSASTLTSNNKSSTEWVVHILSTSSVPNDPSLLRSPRDITMNVSATQKAFDFQFNPFEHYALDCIEV